MFTQIDAIKQSRIIQTSHVPMTLSVGVAAWLKYLHVWSLRSFPVATTILFYVTYVCSVINLRLVQEINMSLSLSQIFFLTNYEHDS